METNASAGKGCGGRGRGRERRGGGGGGWWWCLHVSAAAALTSWAGGALGCWRWLLALLAGWAAQPCPPSSSRLGCRSVTVRARRLSTILCCTLHLLFQHLLALAHCSRIHRVLVSLAAICQHLQCTVGGLLGARKHCITLATAHMLSNAINKCPCLRTVPHVSRVPPVCYGRQTGPSITESDLRLLNPPRSDNGCDPCCRQIH